MQSIKHFYSKTLRYDLVNKFCYTHTKKLPTIKKIILNFGCRNNNIQSLASSLLALELITHQKGNMQLTKHSNILLKIRKGNPTGCKVTLRKQQMFACFSIFLTEILPKVKNFEGFKFGRKVTKNSFSFELQDTFNFQELEEHYYLFNSLPNLNVTVVTNAKNKKELLFLLRALKFPVK